MSRQASPSDGSGRSSSPSATSASSARGNGPPSRGIRIGFYWKRRRSGGSGFSAGEGAIQQAVRVVERRTKDLSAGEILPCGGNAPQHAHG